VTQKEVLQTNSGVTELHPAASDGRNHALESSNGLSYEVNHNIGVTQDDYGLPEW
jgi:hypothetical protein